MEENIKSKWEILNVSKECYFEVDEDWLDSIPAKEKIESLELHCLPNEKLIVCYKDGYTVSYDNIHGTWGHPTAL